VDRRRGVGARRRRLFVVTRRLSFLGDGAVDLLARRWQYGRAAVRFKAGEADIRNATYLPVFLERRRAWAVAVGLAPDYVEALFRTITGAS